jgi:hypothetical protein
MSAVRHPYRLWSAFTNSLKGRGLLRLHGVLSARIARWNDMGRMKHKRKVTDLLLIQLALELRRRMKHVSN